MLLKTLLKNNLDIVGGNKSMITLALIGKGEWGKNYLKAVKNIKNCQIKYIVTHNYKILSKIKDIDGIIIATPSQTHSKIIQYFPDKFLLVEKPLTTNLAEALKIKNKKIMVGYTYLYNLNLLKEIKKVGKILFMSIYLQNTSNSKNLNPLWELMPHPISLFLSFLKEPIKVIFSFCNKDKQIVLLEHKKGRCLAYVGYNYLKKARIINIVGTKKTINFEDKKINKISPLENELRTFINFINGKKIKTNLSYSIKVMKILSQIKKYE